MRGAAAVLALVMGLAGATNAGAAAPETPSTEMPPAQTPWAIERFALLVGNNEGAASEPSLRYAEDDATKLYDVLKDVGDFPPENMLLLEHESAETARRALIALNDRIRARASGGAQVMLLVYYSGHADAMGLHLGRSTLETGELEQLVRGSASAFRLLIVDSCRSGALTRVKGGRPAPPVPIALNQRIAGEGAVFLSSSAADEDSQESDELRGSFFTHYLISGLLGPADTDGDAAVTLEEAYRYAYDSTLKASSRTLAGLQHPTFRYELRGHGGLVLSTLAHQGRSLVQLPAGRGYLLMQRDADGPVVAEVGAGDRVRRLSLRPDRYFVRGRGPDFLVEGTVTVAPGTTLTLDDRGFRRIEYARLVRKGDAHLHVAHGPQAGYVFHTALSNSQSLCQGAFAAYPFEFRELSIAPGVDYCRAGFTNTSLSAAVYELGVGVRASHAWDLPFLTVDLGANAGAAILRQTFMTQGQAPDRSSAAFTLGAGLTLMRDLWQGFYVLGRADAQSYFYRQLQASGDMPVKPASGARISMGLGKRW